MFDVRVDPVKNRLYLIVDGFFSVAEAEEASAAIRAGVDQLQPGFDLISDNQGYKPGSPKVAELIAANQTYALQHGLNRTVRIVSENIIGQMQFDRVSKNNHLDVQYAASIEDADTLLDG